jgi:hypothetical protein
VSRTSDDWAAKFLAHGFSHRQARFLVLATEHAGFCLRRQYATFAGIEDGKRVHQLFARLVAYRWATAFRFVSNRGYIYDLKGVARVIGHTEGRYRTHISAALVARQIMALDAVLSQSEGEWHGAEQGKVDLFRREFGVPDAMLPHCIHRVRQPEPREVTRYFPARLPIGVFGDTRHVRFLYIATSILAQGFETFLWSHARLFGCLPHWSVLVMHPSSLRDLDAHKRAFDRLAEEWPSLSQHGDLTDLRWLFDRRRAVERGEWSHAPLLHVRRYRRLRQRLSTPAVESLYAAWLTFGEAGFTHALTDVPPFGELLVQELPVCYDQFGLLPGEC